MNTYPDPPDGDPAITRLARLIEAVERAHARFIVLIAHGAAQNRVLEDGLQILRSAIADARQPVDPRDPDRSREGVFVYHNCWKCHDGEKPCVKGNPRLCGNLHARND